MRAEEGAATRCSMNANGRVGQTLRLVGLPALARNPVRFWEANRVSYVQNGSSFVQELWRKGARVLFGR
jgi:hypothetical protein